MRLLALLIALVFAASAPIAPLPALGEDTRFSLCEALPYRSCVHNGDLIYIRGEPIRLSDIATPDRYLAACPRASNIAWYAAIRMRDLLNEGPFEIVEDLPGAGGERMARLERNGVSIGDALVAEELAQRRTASAPDWC